MTTHTTGPWHLGKESEFGVAVFAMHEYIGGDKITEKVALCSTDGLYHQGMRHDQLLAEVMANARLIAAAPHLAEACEAALKYWHSNGRNFQSAEPAYLTAIRAALAKAGR